jgi:light-regulated signal transduction histidine kinase (bacteriophytochrome)
MMKDEKENMTEAGKKNMERVHAAATRMRQLIEDLLAFSRLSSVERQFEMADLHLILEDVKSELKDTIFEKQAIIEAIGLLPVNIVVFQFRQLIYNLISNALKFSVPHLPTRITIETCIIKYNDVKLRNLNSLPQKCDYWSMSVKDNGIGFEAEFSERIFVMFQRLHRSDEYAGTGIGLAIVKKIVDNHNGIIIAKGDLNKGATFEIYIPVRENLKLVS